MLQIELMEEGDLQSEDLRILWQGEKLLDNNQISSTLLPPYDAVF